MSPASAQIVLQGMPHFCFRRMRLVHQKCFGGHDHPVEAVTALSGLFFNETAPTNYRDWLNSDYTFYDTMAPKLHDLGVLCEPDSREPWFVCESHDQSCLEHTVAAFEHAVDETLDELKDPSSAKATA